MYVCMYVCIPMHIYIYIHMYLVGPGNSLGVSVAFPSFTFPSRFRYVSVSVSVTFPPRFRHVSIAFPLRFRSRFHCASVGQAPARRKLPPKNSPSIVVLLNAGGRADPKPQLIGTIAPTSSRNLRSRVRSRGSPFSGASPDILPTGPNLGIRCDAGPRVALTRMCFSVFEAAFENPRSHWGHFGSKVLNVSVMFPSTFPSRFRQHFRCVSVNVSVTFPLGRCVPMETIRKLSQRFRGPLSICIYVCMHVCMHIYIYIYIYMITDVTGSGNVCVHNLFAPAGRPIIIVDGNNSTTNNTHIHIHNHNHSTTTNNKHTYTTS